MRNITRILGTLSLLSLIEINTASAIVIGGSNLSLMGYADPECREPHKPYNLDTDYEINKYNDDMEEYIECLEEYTQSARNDIKRIEEAIQNTNRKLRDLQ